MEHKMDAVHATCEGFFSGALYTVPQLIDLDKYVDYFVSTCGTHARRMRLAVHIFSPPSLPPFSSRDKLSKTAKTMRWDDEDDQGAGKACDLRGRQQATLSKVCRRPSWQPTGRAWRRGTLLGQSVRKYGSGWKGAEDRRTERGTTASGEGKVGCWWSMLVLKSLTRLCPMSRLCPQYVQPVSRLCPCLMFDQYLPSISNFCPHKIQYFSFWSNICPQFVLPGNQIW